jgi:hypothetical protein
MNAMASGSQPSIAARVSVWVWSPESSL